MRKQPLFIALSNQKGGVGKSAFTILLASYFHYLTDRRVLVVDCDYPQHSLRGIRDREMQLIDKSTIHKSMVVSQYERIQKRIYPILTSPPEKAHESVTDFLAESEDLYDVVIFDLPGTVNSSGVLKSIVNMDYIFTPICADKMVMQSSLSFVTTIQDFQQNKEYPLKNIYVFWNMVDKRVSGDVQNVYTTIMNHLNVNILQTQIPSTTRYSKEMTLSTKPFFRSTIFPPSLRLISGTNLDVLINEICEMIKL